MGPRIMSGCCDEYGCRRRTPFALYLGDLTGQVYLATRVRVIAEHADGTATLSADAKHDVTAQVREFIRRNPEWVREELSEQNSPYFAAGAADGERDSALVADEKEPAGMDPERAWSAMYQRGYESTGP